MEDPTPTFRSLISVCPQSSLFRLPRSEIWSEQIHRIIFYTYLLCCCFSSSRCMFGTYFVCAFSKCTWHLVPPNLHERPRRSRAARSRLLRPPAADGTAVMDDEYNTQSLARMKLKHTSPETTKPVTHVWPNIHEWRHIVHDFSWQIPPTQWM